MPPRADFLPPSENDPAQRTGANYGCGGGEPSNSRSCGIDGAAILRGADYLGLDDRIDPHALLTGWRDGLRALQGGIEKHAGPDRSCLARGIVDDLDDLVHNSSLEDILEALKEQIEIAEDIANGFSIDPVEEWRRDYYASLGLGDNR